MSMLKNYILKQILPLNKQYQHGRVFPCNDSIHTLCCCFSVEMLYFKQKINQVGSKEQEFLPNNCKICGIDVNCLQLGLCSACYTVHLKWFSLHTIGAWYFLLADCMSSIILCF